MSLLKDIAFDVEQVAEAIAIAVGVEVEIVDEELTVVGGTAVYRDMVGSKEEAGRLNGNFLYASVLRSGKTEFIEDVDAYEDYGSSLASVNGIGELAEICTPIKVGQRIIGIIGLVALTESQKKILIDRAHNMVPFVEKMADLLAAKAEVQAMLAYNAHAKTKKYTFDDIISESEPMQKIKAEAMIVASGNSNVLITGESGTGKEMFAKAIHYAGPRAGGAFVTVNCGAIPENLLESELFGYEKGAFTGAGEKGKLGKFELADKGTIFLDEIGDMPLLLQVKILHVLQNMSFERVGGNRTIHVDVRIIAATNRDLEALIRSGAFREDLYYRLSVIPLYTPPLRERISDIPLLMRFFLEKYNQFMHRELAGFTKETLQLYLRHDWPGNVRELENAVEYGVNMAQGNEIGLDAVPGRILDKMGFGRTERRDLNRWVQGAPDAEKGLDMQNGAGLAQAFSDPHGGGRGVADFGDHAENLGHLVRQYEVKLIKERLEKYGNSSSAKDDVAKELGISRATLYRKLADMDIN
jgi:transcriptional regulator with PAS, ATPase and Fis domain